MATHPEVRKWLLDTKKRGDFDGHFLHRAVEKFHLFSWATVAGEIDITYRASEATRLWVFQFHVGAREPPDSCRTIIAVSCPERYRLLVSGRRVVEHEIELMIHAGSSYSQRPSYQIVDEDADIPCQPRYEYRGRAEIGSMRLPIEGAFDLV